MRRRSYRWAVVIVACLVTLSALGVIVRGYAAKPPFADQFVLFGPNYVAAWTFARSVHLSSARVAFIDKESRVALVVRSEIGHNVEWVPGCLQGGGLIVRRLDDGYETMIPWREGAIIQLERDGHARFTSVDGPDFDDATKGEVVDASKVKKLMEQYGVQFE